MHGTTQSENSCIESCLHCYRTCASMAMTHCLELGGAHADPKHIRLLMTCAELCRATAHLLVLHSAQYKEVCFECSHICSVSAIECERLGDMEECVVACRECAKCCDIMGQ
jgi:hypothetical protein